MQTLDLIDLVYGEALTIDHLDDYLRTFDKGEDLYLEIKSGRAIKGKGKVPKDSIVNPGALRKYISGFANSGGGLLVLGVDESSDWKIDGCPTKVGGAQVDNWVRRSYQGLSPYLVPPPKVCKVKNEDGRVVVLVAVRRSNHLTPCVESGSLVYYFRVGDSTFPAPKYLVEDLYSGRRRRPRFSIEAKIRAIRYETGARHTVFEIEIVVINNSFTWVDESMVGVVFLYEPSNIYTEDKEIPELLRTSLLVQANREVVRLDHMQRQYGALIPLEKTSKKPFRIPVPTCFMPWSAAIYVLPRDGVLSLYQLRIESHYRMSDPDTVGGIWPNRQKRTWAGLLIPTQVENPTVEIGKKKLSLTE